MDLKDIIAKIAQKSTTTKNKKNTNGILVKKGGDRAVKKIVKIDPKNLSM